MTPPSTELTNRKIYRVTERYTGERFVYVEAETKAEALSKARAGSIWDADEDPTHYDYRYSRAQEYDG